MDGLIIECTTPACPVQFEGTIDGVDLYFRSRGEHWRIGIGGDVVGSPDWMREAQYGVNEFDASWMPRDEAIQIIEESCAMWREFVRKLPAVDKGSVWRHLKTDHVYEILAVARIEKTMEWSIVYRQVTEGRWEPMQANDTKTWVRPAMEFLDGRFMLIGRIIQPAKEK